MIYWFTGQPGSGKTTLALALKAALQKAGFPVVHLDGEFLRELMDNRDFSEPGRTRNILAAQKLASKLQSEGIVVVASFVSPYRKLREEFKKRHDVLEIYVHTTELRGREPHFAAGFEPPEADFVDVDTTAASVAACLEKVLRAAAAGARPWGRFTVRTSAAAGRFLNAAAYEPPEAA
jgi:adenylylsulfate kinase-like enzyme